jgi:hypothetical protein
LLSYPFAKLSVLGIKRAQFEIGAAGTLHFEPDGVFCELLPVESPKQGQEMSRSLNGNANATRGVTFRCANDTSSCPPHDGVRRRWWIKVASAVSLG